MSPPVCCCAVFLRVLFAQRTAGARSAPGLPCALLDQEGGVTKQSSGDMRRENGKLCLQVKSALEDGDAAPCSVIASAAKQSSLRPRRDSGLLRCARNDDVEAAVRHTPALVPRTQRSALAVRCRAGAHLSAFRRVARPAQQRSRVAARPGRVNDRAASPRHPPPPAPSPPTRSRRIAAARSRSPRLPWSRTTPRG